MIREGSFWSQLLHALARDTPAYRRGSAAREQRGAPVKRGKRVVVIETHEDQLIAIGPVYTDESVEQLRAEVVRCGCVDYGPVELVSLADWRAGSEVAR